MEEIVKKAKAPAKPRKTAVKKTAVPSNVTEITASANGTERKAPYEQVAQLAHRFWAERGHQHGHDAEDWFRAEQELRGKAS
jgi:hypothetical protein